jgi:hypothetical protein
VPETDLKVIRIMRGCNLDDARPEILLDVGIGNNRNLFADERQNYRLSDQMRISLIVRMHGDGRISEKRLGTCRRENQIAGTVRNRILDMIEKAVLSSYSTSASEMEVRHGGTS